GSAATGTATLSIAPDSLPPATTAASLIVAENSGATGIGIMAPSDANYAASALKIQVTGLPNDGTVLLPDGTTPVFSGQMLTVAQLTALQFRPLSGLFGTSSAFNYKVINPSGLTTSGTAALS